MIVVTHGERGGLRQRFEDALQAQCDALDIPLARVDWDVDAPAGDPQVMVVFPPVGSAWTPADAGLHPACADAAFPILPVVEDAPEARFLPTSLASINAFQRGIWRDAWSEGLVDEVLSFGWQRRRERRVFISYRRTDSERVAQQLYAELTRCGYMAFLDDVSIEKGANFQHELNWWLNDADVVIVLVTPNFENSRWCMEEIAFAQSHLIGLLGVEWPPSVLGPAPTRPFPSIAGGASAGAAVLKAIDPDQRLRLDDADFTGDPSDPLCEQELDDHGLARLMAHCARQRSQAIRLRLENLIPLAERVLKPQHKLQPAGSPGDYTFRDGDGVECFVRVLPFRPEPVSVQDTFASAGSHRLVGCLYSEFDVHDPRARAMRWLTAGRHQSTPGAVHQETRLWVCVGDRIEP